jgi:hypothetical protein
MSRGPSPPRPPSPPAVARALHLFTYQIVALSLFVIVTLLALLGTFGQASAYADGRGATLALRVEHPARFRYGQRGSLRAWITNTSPRRLDSVRVTVDTAYLNAFSSVRFTPSVDEAYAVVLTGLQPRETRLVHAEIEADRVGRRHGTVTVSAAGSDSVRVLVHTLVFP